VLGLTTVFDTEARITKKGDFVRGGSEEETSITCEETGTGTYIDNVVLADDRALSRRATLNVTWTIGFELRLNQNPDFD
jgi:hypothetical protein